MNGVLCLAFGAFALGLAVVFFLGISQHIEPPWLLVGLVWLAFTVASVWYGYGLFSPFEQRIEVCRKHLRRSYEWKGPVVGILEMRRHYANYLKGLPNIKEFRSRLVILKEIEEIEEVLNEIIKQYAGFEFQKNVIVLENYHEKCAV